MSNIEISNAEGMSKSKGRKDTGGGRTEKVYDLEERSAQFGEHVIEFLKTIPVTPITKSLIEQLVRSSTSIGANYCEADDSGTKKEFRHRISICKRESRESKHWLRMIAKACPEKLAPARKLWQEAKELHLIFCAIHRRTKSKSS